MFIPNNNTLNNEKFKFLIIENELTNRKLTELLLNSRFNCEVYSVGTCEEALAEANNQLFNLIFMNIGLPATDELLAVKMIRQGSVNKHTPIIATSGTLYGEKFCLEAGINAFLAKPFSILEFENIIKKFLPLE